LQYNQAKERSESGNMDKGNGKEQQGDTQQELAQTLVSLLRSIRGTRLQYNQAKERSESGNMDKGNGHMARDCPKVSDMKATNTPTSGGRGSRTVVGRGSMATFRHCLTHGGAKSGEGLQYNQAKERSESGNMDKGNGLQYNQAKERSESGNMDKGNGKEQQGDTQQELAQTLVSLLRSIGGTSNQVTEASIDLCYMFQEVSCDDIRAALVAVRTTSYIELLESARTVELELGIFETSRGREKGSFSDLHPDSHGRREVVPFFPRRGY
ncbi:hypothetical protein HPP92_026887, partial [Vanilla planifolia]